MTVATFHAVYEVPAVINKDIEDCLCDLCNIHYLFVNTFNIMIFNKKNIYVYIKKSLFSLTIK